MHRALAVISALLIASAVGEAQETPGQAAEPSVEGSFANLTRVETWRFFESPSQEVDPDYTFWGNRSDLTLNVRGPRFDLAGGFSYVRVEELPQDAIGPGGLGTGAFYFASSGVPYSYQVFLTSLSASWHDADRRRALTVGRMAYTSGAEGDNAATAQKLAAVRRLAIDGRLVGTFDWSFYQRRFDGARADWRADRWYGGGSAFLVTQGGYEESANLTMDPLFVGTGFVGRWHGTEAESQTFGVVYRDRRPIDVRPDNSLTTAPAADITIASLGASHTAARDVNGGAVDYAGWGTWQFGDWYGQPHRAYAVAGQAGFQWNQVLWKPWARGGGSYASGDGDGRDGSHQTFFPMLQDTRTYGQSMVYAQANLRDLFIQILAEPHSRAHVRGDLHRLDLVKAADRWYQGSGATSRDGRFFGYSTRPSSGARGLGTVLEGSVDVRISRYWSINAYAGRMWGGPVVRGIFAGDRLFYWYIENVLRLTLSS